MVQPRHLPHRQVGDRREFLPQQCERELDTALRTDLRTFKDNRIAVRFQHERPDRGRPWWRRYGNELWGFDEHGLIRRRETSINDVRIDDRPMKLAQRRTP